MALPLRTASSDLRWRAPLEGRSRALRLRYAITNDGCTVAAPVVTASSLDGTNRPLSSGLTLTISGLNYGGANLTPTSMSPTAALCSTTSWTSLTTVACTAQANGAGGGIAAALMLTVSLQAGTGGPQKFTFDGRHGPTLLPHNEWQALSTPQYPTVPHSANHSASVVFALLFVSTAAVRCSTGCHLRIRSEFPFIWRRDSHREWR
jgi:hypothetical protein